MDFGASSAALTAAEYDIRINQMRDDNEASLKYCISGDSLFVRANNHVARVAFLSQEQKKMMDGILAANIFEAWRLRDPHVAGAMTLPPAPLTVEEVRLFFLDRALRAG